MIIHLETVLIVRDNITIHEKMRKQRLTMFQFKTKAFKLLTQFSRLITTPSKDSLIEEDLHGKSNTDFTHSATLKLNRQKFLFYTILKKSGHEKNLSKT